MTTRRRPYDAHRDAFLMPGGAVAADDLVVVSHVTPRAPGLTGGRVQLGHLVVEPRHHMPGWAGLSDDEAAAVGRWCARAVRALTREAGAEHVYTATVGHAVAHLHVHLIPRYPGTPGEYAWHRVGEWPRHQGPEEEAAALARRLRATLGT